MAPKQAEIAKHAVKHAVVAEVTSKHGAKGEQALTAVVEGAAEVEAIAGFPSLVLYYTVAAPRMHQRCVIAHTFAESILVVPGGLVGIVPGSQSCLLVRGV